MNDLKLDEFDITIEKWANDEYISTITNFEVETKIEYTLKNWTEKKYKKN